MFCSTATGRPVLREGNAFLSLKRKRLALSRGRSQRGAADVVGVALVKTRIHFESGIGRGNNHAAVTL